MVYQMHSGKGGDMEKREKLAQEAMLESDPQKALDLYNDAKREAVKAGDMTEAPEIEQLGKNKYGFTF